MHEPEICKRRVTKKLTPVDIIIGKKIRQLRTLRGYSQVKIAKAMGITFQQFQKYECGINRICVSRLLEICKYCNVSSSYFFDHIEDANNNRFFTNDDCIANSFLADSATDDQNMFGYENVKNKEVLTLIKLFNNIKDPLVRKKAISLIKVLSDNN